MTNRGNSFSATAGQVLSVNLTADNPINFYLMTSKDYDSWNSLGRCAVNVPTLIDQREVTSVSISLLIPDSGKYQFLFLNWSHENAAKIDYKAQIVGVATQAQSLATSTMILQNYFTTTSTLAQTTTLISSSIRTEQVGFSLGSSGILTIFAVVGVVVIIVAALTYMMIARRRKK
jgi:hypothetical protein